MDEYMAIVKLFAGNFAPKDWAFCNGQLLSIAQNQALFSLLGTTFGGDGINTFGLPDLRNRVPVGVGPGTNGAPTVQLGEKWGEPYHTLTIQELPVHQHAESVSSADASQTVATTGASIATPTTTATPPVQTLGFNTQTPNLPLTSTTISNVGGSQPHNNMQPYLGISYIICLSGLYPPRP